MIDPVAAGGRDEHTLLAALLDEARSPVLALDADGRILYANAAASLVVRRERQDLIGKPFGSLLRAGERRAFRSALRSAEASPATVEIAFANGPATSMPVVVRRLPGTPFVAVSFDAGDAPARPDAEWRRSTTVAGLDRFFLRFPFGVLGVHRDGRVAFVNPRARLMLGDRTLRVGRTLPASSALHPLVQRALAAPASVQTATESVGERSLRVTALGWRGDEPAVVVFEDVTDQQRQAEAMREFVRNAAHQLRTPLTGIATAIEVLQAGAKNDPAERDRFLAHVETSSRRLIKLARGLLVLARAQSGETIRFDFVALRPLLDGLAQQAQPREGVELVVDCDASLTVLAEQALAQEALAALVENAVDHTDHGSIVLSAAERDGKVAISVTDSGGGVLPEHRERIVEPFYRPTASGEGFGLGLAIAAQAVKAMGGRLQLGEAEGGARFTVELPSGRLGA